LQITIPGNYLYWILYLSFSASQNTAVSRKEIGILCVNRNKSPYLDNPEDGCKLVLAKYLQPLASVNDVISGKPVISSAPL